MGKNTVITNANVLCVTDFVKDPQNKLGVPRGYNIFIPADDFRNPLLVDSETFLLPQEILDSLNNFKELGIIGDDENQIIFYSNHPELRHKYGVLFRSEKYDYITSKYSGPILRYNSREKPINTSIIAELDWQDFPTFEQRVKARFANYDFTPANGWKPFYYLDFVTGWEFPWTKEAIQAMDGTITAGSTLNKIWFMLRAEIPETDWQEISKLPDNWIVKAYGLEEAVS